MPTDGPTPSTSSPFPDQNPPPDQETPQSEPVWTYRGYRLRASEFTTAMVHLFRAEVQRANMWRQRLDTTTNWAVVTTGASLSIGFAQSEINHIVILLNVVLVTIFLFIEARRYRYYELWSYRVRLMETDFFAAMLVPPFHPSADWAEALAENLLHPHFPISMWEALGRRLRRNYLAIYSVIAAAWIVKLALLPTAVTTWREFSQRATVGRVAGEAILAFFIVFVFVLVLLSVLTVRLQGSAGEVLPRFGDVIGGVHLGQDKEPGKRAWFRPTRRRPQLLVLVITDKASSVSEQILKELRRGVTAIPGTGMYTGKSHMVLMCALTTTEIPQLKTIVAEVDPGAFVVVTPAQQVFGLGFIPLREED
jgi:uncharacterized membrane protein